LTGDASQLNKSGVHWDLIKPMKDGYVMVTTTDNQRYHMAWDEDSGLWKHAKAA